jgi:hypothetical protein
LVLLVSVKLQEPVPFVVVVPASTHVGLPDKLVVLSTP